MTGGARLAGESHILCSYDVAFDGRSFNLSGGCECRLLRCCKLAQVDNAWGC